MANQPTVQGVHFVGSTPFANPQEFFSKASPLGGRIRRMPDGETGIRHQWTQFQRETWGDARPEIVLAMGSYKIDVEECTPEEGAELQASLPPANTRFDDFALESYPLFKQAKKEGKLPAEAKFMVTFPTPLATLSINFDPRYRKYLEKPYIEGLTRAIQNIQSQIAAEDLSIQFDIAVEFGVLEGFVQPWWPNKEEGMYNRIFDLCALINPKVELGFHLCYGDFQHKHFKEPADAKFLNDVAVKLIKGAGRSVEFVHLPVPVERNDDAYFAPLKELESVRGETEIYLGLVHPNDVPGTRKRIETAGKILGRFGVATECGLGRTPAEDIDSILETLGVVSEPF